MSEASPGVVELVAERIKDGSQPDQRDDPYKLGIIFQGGAMRGVVATGANIALESMMGDSEPFDRADNTSAGAYSWAALASRTGVKTSTIYYEELSDGFIRKSNLLRGRNPVNLDLLMAAVNEGEKALDFSRLLHHPTEAIFYGSLIPEALPVEFRLGAKALEAVDQQTDAKHTVNCRSREDVLRALNATALIPFLAGPPVQLPDGRLVVDGGVSAGRIPLEQAIEAGCTHILVVVTDKNITPEQMVRSKQERLAAFMLCRQYPELAAAMYWRGHEIHAATITKLRQAEVGELQGPKIQVVRTPDAAIPKRDETDPHTLFRAAQATEEVVLAMFKPHGLTRDLKVTTRPPRTRRA